MLDIASEIVSIADACLGGLQGRSTLLIGPEEQRSAYVKLLRRAKMKYIYEEETPERVPYLLPYVQLVICMPALSTTSKHPDPEPGASMLTAASIAKGCLGRHKPLLIFDLATTPSVEELAGLLPAVCLYTPADLRDIIAKAEAKAS